jgi:hypothetical protein
LEIKGRKQSVRLNERRVAFSKRVSNLDPFSYVPITKNDRDWQHGYEDYGKKEGKGQFFRVLLNMDKFEHIRN